MVTIKARVWMPLLIGVFAVAAVGCATTGGASRTIGPNDLPSLAGKWNGTLTLASGTSTQGTLDMAPSGDYTVQAAGFSAAGRAQVRDGNLTLVPSATSGGGGARTGERSSVASLSERSDGMLVLRGSGSSASGPFNFEVMRPK